MSKTTTTATPSNRTIVVWNDGNTLHFVDMMTKVQAGPNAAFVAENMANQARLRAKAKGYKAAYCTAEALEAVKTMATPNMAIEALWSRGWQLSAERAGTAKANTGNVAIAKPSATASVTIEVATQFANLDNRKVVGYAAKMAYGEHNKVISGLMTDGATNGKAAIVAITEAVQALKKPCAITIVYDHADRQMATLGATMANGYKTKTGKASACVSQMMALRPYWDKHTFTAKEIGSTSELREVAKSEIAKLLPVVTAAPIADTDDDEIELEL